jgi:hypothetical protein
MNTNNNNIITILQSTLRSSLYTSNNTTRNDEEIFNILSSNSTAIIALVEIFYNVNITEEDQIRALAGIILKNLLKQQILNQDFNTISYIHDHVPQILNHPNKLIRSTAAQIISTLIAQIDILERGSTILDYLMTTTMEETSKLHHNTSTSTGGNEFLCDGTTRCLLHIAEDASQRLESDECGRPLIRLIPFCIEILKQYPQNYSQLSPGIRERCLDLIALYLPTMPPALSIHIESYLSTLAMLTRDPSLRIRTKVLQALSMLFEHEQHMMIPHMQSICIFALDCLRACNPSQPNSTFDQDKLSREACDFFNSICYQSSEVAPEALFGTEILSVLIPLLVERMIFSMDELNEKMDEMNDDAHIPDKIEGGVVMNINLLSLSQQQQSSINNNNNQPSSMLLTSTNTTTNDDNDSVIDEDDSNNYDINTGGSDGGTWTLRRAAATALETFSEKIPATIFAPLILSLLEQQLSPQFLDQHHQQQQQSSSFQLPSWVYQEAALTALGAVAHGLGNFLSSALPTLIPFLLRAMETSPQSLVRKIACWTLSKFSRLICGGGGTATAATTTTTITTEGYTHVINCLSLRIRDSNKGVQFAAISSLSCFIEDASSLDLSAGAPSIASILAWALNSFQIKNLKALYDAISVFFDKFNDRKSSLLLLPDPSNNNNSNNNNNISIITSNRSSIQVLAEPLWKKFDVEGNVNNPNLFPLLWAMRSMLNLIADSSLSFSQGVLIIHKCLVICETCIELLTTVASGVDDFWFMVQGDLTFMASALDVIAVLFSKCGTQTNHGTFALVRDNSNNGMVDFTLVNRLITVLCTSMELFASIDDQIVEAAAKVFVPICKNYQLWLITPPPPPSNHMSSSENEWQQEQEQRLTVVVHTCINAMENSTMDPLYPPITLRAVLGAVSELTVLFKLTNQNNNFSSTRFDLISNRIIAYCGRLVIDFVNEVWAREMCETACLVISRTWLFGFSSPHVARETGMASGDAIRAWTKIVANISRIEDIRDLAHLYLGWLEGLIYALQGIQSSTQVKQIISPQIVRLAIMQCRKSLSLENNMNNDHVKDEINHRLQLVDDLMVLACS